MASDIKWIKITTDMFDDEKIDFISSLPEGDSLIVIWIRLLTMAGKNNAGGFIFLTENIPYTDDMLAHKFKKPTNIIKLAFETFERLGMVNFDETGKIMIANWDKHQSVEGMDRVRELTRARVAKHRELKDSTNNKDIDKELDIDIEQINATVTLQSVTEKKPIPCQEIIDKLNRVAGKNFKLTAKHRECITARWNEGYSLDDFFTVIEKKNEEWQGTEQAQYIRPVTLFGTKFDGYLNQPKAIKKQPELSYIEQERLNRRKVMDELAKRNGGQNDREGVNQLPWGKG